MPLGGVDVAVVVVRFQREVHDAGHVEWAV